MIATVATLVYLIYTHLCFPNLKEQIGFILKQKDFDGADLFQIPASTF